MSKPKVNTNPVANQYAGPNERIVEYSAGKAGGGLISFRVTDDGTLLVQLYQHDDSVEITTGKAPKVEIVHGRDPDEGCDLNVFVDGKRLDSFYEEDVDPGRGYERAYWNERIEDTRNDETLTPAFREHAVATLEQYGDSKYITD